MYDLFIILINSKVFKDYVSLKDYARPIVSQKITITYLLSLVISLYKNLTTIINGFPSMLLIH